MANGDDANIHQLIGWGMAAQTAVLAFFGLMARWIAKRLIGELDSKATKEDVNELAQIIAQKADRDAVAERHEENKGLLTEIKDQQKEIRTIIDSNETKASGVRDQVQRAVETLGGRVGRIEGYIEGRTEQQHLSGTYRKRKK